MGRIFLAVIFTLLLVCQAQAQELSAGYVMVGSAGDGGWSYAIDQGRRKADEKFPQVKSIAAESVQESGEVSFVMEQLIKRENCQLIFATSYGYTQFVLSTAAKYPEVKFVHISGDQRTSNVATYFGRIYQARYLSGLVAGKMSKSGQIGYVAAFPIPEVVRGINAFTVGVRAINPEARVKVMWLYSWYDQAMERELSQQLIGQGCDVMALHADTGEVARTCENSRVYVIGYNNDMSMYAPTMHLTAPVWHWQNLFAYAYQQVLQGTWHSEELWWGLKEGVVGLAPFGRAVDQQTRLLVKEHEQRIIAGEFDVFDGPLNDSQGKLRVAENQTMSDRELLEFNWFVEGVDGEL